MKFNKTRLLPLAALLLPMAASAHNYTFVEGGYVSRDTGAEDDAGVRIAGSAPIAPNLAIIGEYADTGPFEQLSAGVEFHTPMNPILDLTLGATLESIEAGRADETGLGLRGGLRWQVANTPLELNPGIRYVDVFDESSTSLRMGALFAMTRELDLQGAIQGGDDDRVELGVRYNFGRAGSGRYAQ